MARPWLTKSEVLEMTVNPNKMTEAELRRYVRQQVDKLIVDHVLLLEALHDGNAELVQYATDATRG